MRTGLLAVAAVIGAFVAGVHVAQARQQPPLFVMMYTTGPAWDASVPPDRQRHFDSHSANLRRLRENGSIVAGGRFGPWGLILVNAADSAAASALFAPDSSLATGTFRGELHRWSTIYEGFIPGR